VKLRPEGSEPWLPGYRYSELLPALSLNLLVRDTQRSVAFYREVLGAELRYVDVDFAALQVGGAEVMLHADHTHEQHPWHSDLAGGAPRGLGAQLRLLGLDPDEVERRALEAGALVARATTDRAGHGWREVLVRDPDGYEWAVGVLIPPAAAPPDAGPPSHPDI
jgi:catechol 2,3-dioxygenase-like lactoylglutathione lyase family enzyme